jgi:hypothetical protein
MAGRTIVRSFVRTSGPLTYQLPLKGFAMNISQLLLRGSFASLAAILLVLPQRAFADTYQIYDLGSSSRVVYGLTDQGGVVMFDQASSCDVFDHPCYSLLGPGMPVYFGVTPPIVTYDNGTPCSPNLPVGMTLTVGVCNGGREALGATFGSVAGLFIGTDPFTDLLNAGTVTTVKMNAFGDIAWSGDVSAAGDGNYLAYNLTAHSPEPSSLILFVTGSVGAACMLRRRIVGC